MSSELLDEFIFDARDHLTTAGAQLMELENQPGSLEHLNALMGTLHTIKGNSGFVNLGNLYKLLHGAENLLQTVRDTPEHVCPPNIVNQLFQVLDTVEAILTRLEAGEDDEVDWLAAINQAIAEAEASLAAPAPKSWSDLGLFLDQEESPFAPGLTKILDPDKAVDARTSFPVSAAPPDSPVPEKTVVSRFSSPLSSPNGLEASEAAPGGTAPDSVPPAGSVPLLASSEAAPADDPPADGFPAADDGLPSEGEADPDEVCRALRSDLSNGGLRFRELSDGRLAREGRGWLKFLGSGDGGLVLDVSGLTSLSGAEMRLVRDMVLADGERFGLVVDRAARPDFWRVLSLWSLDNKTRLFPDRAAALGQQA
ncbi:MAG: Hpt domain-containing protein [Deltaproteobacteria bacterium]|jgi:HPt (histidine-containing phosphotransfer) domain-containing protein|nr:Hpt domain-containing protein [Deltaproteobacteria bacterium]